MTAFKLKCVVLEDEDDILDWLVRKLKQYPELEIVGEATTVDDSYRLIVSEKPDFAFMDVHLIGGDAFGLLSRLKDNGIPIPFIVIATGYPDYVMKALNEYREHIVQYLVKPFVENWQSKFSKAIDSLLAARLKQENFTFQENSENSSKYANERFAFLQNKGNLIRLDFDRIVYLEAAGGGESLVILEESYFQVSQSLVKMLTLLPPEFIRISKSNVVNLNQVVSVNKGERTVELKIPKKNKHLGISSSYYMDFIKRLPRA
jgi:DNA-binding LytR/AlgR family response regulator